LWLWVWFVILPFLILAILEEMIEFFVQRYMLGPAEWEGKLKDIFARSYSGLKKKLRLKQSE